MKIDDSIKKTTPLPVGTGTAGARTGTGVASPSATPAQSDSVHLSSRAKALAGSSGTAVFNAEKVEEIKAAIADGRFQVDPEKVADGLLDTVTDLIHSRKP